MRRPRQLLGHRLSNSTERANPSVLRPGHLPRMGAKRSTPLPRKQTRALLKTPELKGLGCAFFPALLTQLMIPFPLSQKLQLQGIVPSAGFRSRFHCLSMAGSGPRRLEQALASARPLLPRCCRFPPPFLTGGNLCRLL